MPNADTATPTCSLAAGDEITLKAVISNPITETPIDQLEHQRACHLIGRLGLLLFDLNLDRVLGGWASPTSKGLTFRPLTLSDAEKLIKALEDVVDGRPPASFGPGAGQLSFFENGE